MLYKSYRLLIKQAAKYQIMIDAHEPIKPTGIRRTYPNMMTREGTRGMEGVNEDLFADIIVRLGSLVSAAPEIIELDLNPLLGTKKHVTAVDARIRIEKQS